MQENLSQTADVTAEPQQFFGDDIDRALQAAFNNPETVEQVDNLDTAENVEDQIDPETETEQADEPKTEETAEETAEETETADFAALENKPVEVTPIEYPDVESLKAKYPRQSKDLIAEAAEFAGQAKKGNEFIQQIGGDEYIEPMAIIAQGLKESKPAQIFQGIVQIGNQNTLLDVVGNAIHLAVNKAKGFQETEETKEFGEKLELVTNTILSEKFGEQVSLDKLESLVKYDQLGWVEAIERWKEAGYVDPDEFDEMLEADKEPAKFLTLKQQLQKESEAKLAAEAKLNEVESTKLSQVEIDFDKTNTDSLESVLEGVVWKKSALKDLDTDPAELKEEKAAFRALLLKEAKEHFRSSPDRKELLNAFKRGEQNSPNYKQTLTSAVNSAILQTKEKTGFYERIIAKLYGNTRNGQIAKSVKPSTPTQSNLQPSQPVRVESTKIPTTQDIEKRLEQAFLGV